jgi:peptidoglycan L-alanyl-D-glutamate endopeptidase CwlK
MWKYGERSLGKLATVHPRLKQVAFRALDRSPYDIAIVHGWRGEDVQNALFDSRASMKRWPDSKHNRSLDIDYELADQISDALDFAPWVGGRIPWDETHIFACIAGCFFAAADELGVRLRWGGDWDTDGNTKEHKLQDWGHLEIIHGAA